MRAEQLNMAQELGGDKTAESLRRQFEVLDRLTQGPDGGPPRPPWRGPASLCRNARGELLILPENLPAVLVWLQTGNQWHRVGMEGEPVAHDARAALEYARALQEEDPTVRPWRVAADVQVIAAEVLGLMRLQRSRRRPA
jgi:hypothetical protein